MSTRLRQLLVVLAILAVVAVNALANALPINGVTTGEVSDSFDSLFVPAGYVFSIWGLIYLGLGFYGIFQAMPSQGDNPRLQRIFGPFLLSTAANIAWILLWHHMLFAFTIVAMVLLLLSLIAIYRRLRDAAGRASPTERWLVRLPFSVYLAWVSVATIANVADVVTLTGWDGFGLGDSSWAIVMLVAGLIIAGTMAHREADVAVPLVFAWAYVGIGVAQATASALVSASAYAAAGIAGLFAVYALYRGRQLGPAKGASAR